jgi:forkhead transcription factor HCM1
MVKIKAPPKPPPSVSPNTNLKMHRDRVRHMLQSPLRRASVLGEETMPWSPAFNLDNTVYNYTDFNLENDFDVFADPMFAHLEANGSPLKRSTKRPRLERFQSTNALADITNSAQRKPVTSAPFLKVPDQTLQVKFDTPSKILSNLDSPGKLFNIGSPSRNPIGSLDDNISSEWLGLEDFQGSEFLADDIGDFGGLDILQGFEKIGGASSQPSRQAPAPKPKSGLERSFSTTF